MNRWVITAGLTVVWMLFISKEHKDSGHHFWAATGFVCAIISTICCVVNFTPVKEVEDDFDDYDDEDEEGDESVDYKADLFKARPPAPGPNPGSDKVLAYSVFARVINTDVQGNRQGLGDEERFILIDNRYYPISSIKAGARGYQDFQITITQLEPGPC